MSEAVQIAQIPPHLAGQGVERYWDRIQRGGYFWGTDTSKLHFNAQMLASAKTDHQVQQIYFALNEGRTDTQSIRSIYDAFTGSGASAVAFANLVKDGGRIYTAELDNEIYDLAAHNISAAGVEKKVELVNASSAEFLAGQDEIIHLLDAIYADPVWGSHGYANGDRKASSRDATIRFTAADLPPESREQVALLAQIAHKHRLPIALSLPLSYASPILEPSKKFENLIFNNGAAPQPCFVTWVFQPQNRDNWNLVQEFGKAGQSATRRKGPPSGASPVSGSKNGRARGRLASSLIASPPARTAETAPRAMLGGAVTALSLDGSGC